MKKKLLIIGAVLLCVLIFVAVKLIYFRPSSPDREIMKFARVMTEHCPSMVDRETRLDKVTFLSGNTLQFDYSLINFDKDSIPVTNLQKFMEPEIYKKIKTSPTLSKYLSKNLTWIYTYNDRNGDFIFKITFTPDQFK